MGTISDICAALILALTVIIYWRKRRGVGLH